MKHIPICQCSHLNNFFFVKFVFFEKHHKSPFSRSLNRAENYFDLVHIDFWVHTRLELF